jgi:hypothetical protein
MMRAQKMKESHCFCGFVFCSLHLQMAMATVSTTSKSRIDATEEIRVLLFYFLSC